MRAHPARAAEYGYKYGSPMQSGARFAGRKMPAVNSFLVYSMVIEAFTPAFKQSYFASCAAIFILIEFFSQRYYRFIIADSNIKTDKMFSDATASHVAIQYIYSRVVTKSYLL